MDNQISFDNEIDDIVRCNKQFRFATELQNTEDENRKNDIRKIIKIIDGQTIDSSESRKKLDLFYQTIDQKSLQNKWTRLSKDQKENRLDDYLKNLIKEPQIFQNIKEKLFELLNQNKLKHEKDIFYDPDIGKIISLPILELDSETKKFNIIPKPTRKIVKNESKQAL